jgi:CHAD domain-containing protein
MESARDVPTHPPSLQELGLRLDPLTRVDAGATARDLIRGAVARSTIRLVAKDPVIRLDEDPEGVHDARVAVRRLRSDLRTFRPLLLRPWTESLRAELEWLGGLLGQVRDAEVLQARLRGRIEALADAGMASGKVLLDDLGISEAQERRRLLDAMESERYRDLVEGLAEGSERPRAEGSTVDDPAGSVGWLMDGPWRALARGVRRLGSDPDDVSLHAVRIEAKRVRYAAEAFAPAFGRPARRFGAAARKLQDVLGDHQDAVVAASWLTERGVDAEERSVAFAAGRLTEHELRERDRARDRWPMAWKRLERSKRFWR